MRALMTGCALWPAGFALAAVNIELAQVHDPGNLADGLVMNNGTSGYGAVAYPYSIGRYEVTNSQYAVFLNSVAPDDANGLYNPDMASNPRAGIVRSGVAGSYTYAVKTDMGDKPVNLVSWFDAARFVNWLHNGQPLGQQSQNTTEDGVYDLAAANITRKPGSIWSLPSENEWYKAGYGRAANGIDQNVQAPELIENRLDDPITTFASR